MSISQIKNIWPANHLWNQPENISQNSLKWETNRQTYQLSEALLLSLLPDPLNPLSESDRSDWSSERKDVGSSSSRSRPSSWKALSAIDTLGVIGVCCDGGSKGLVSKVNCRSSLWQVRVEVCFTAGLGVEVEPGWLDILCRGLATISSGMEENSSWDVVRLRCKFRAGSMLTVANCAVDTAYTCYTEYGLVTNAH